MLLGMLCATGLAGGSASAAGRVRPDHSRAASWFQNPPHVPGGWQVTFRQTFPGSSLNRRIWTTCYPWALGPSGCTHYGKGNDELEWYLPSQDRVYGGVLHLVAQRADIAGVTQSGVPALFGWKSGMVTTAYSFNFMYGYVEIRAEMPTAMGLWPALWLLPSNGAWPPEIDIFEGNGMYRGLQLQSVLHRTNGTLALHVSYVPPASFAGWHTFAVLWTPNSLTWFLDGHEVLHTSSGVPRQPMYLILDLALPGWPGYAPNATTPAVNYMNVQRVEVWQPRLGPAFHRAGATSLY